jgi:hypothetical protein
MRSGSHSIQKLATIGNAENAAKCCQSETGGESSPVKEGGMAERFKAPVLKTGDPRGSVGSNPTPSANFDFQGLQNLIAAETTKANRLSGPLAKF